MTPANEAVRSAGPTPTEIISSLVENVSRYSLVAFVAVLAVCTVMPIVLRILQTANSLDVPNWRSAHSVPIPRGGGLALIAGMVLATLVALPLADTKLILLLIPCLLFALLGGFEDFRGLSVFARLGGQLAAGATAALALKTVVDPTWSVALTALSLLIGSVWYVAVVNVYNFMDGINGISAVTGIVSGLWYLLIGAASELHTLAFGGLILAGVCAGFLPWNFPVARVFLGDVGSYALGCSLASLSALAVLEELPVSISIVPLGLYFVDAALTLLLRLSRGENVLSPHRDHSYQRIARLSNHVVATLCATSVTLVMMSSLLFGTPQLRLLLAVLTVLMLAAYYVVPAYLESRSKK